MTVNVFLAAIPFAITYLLRHRMHILLRLILLVIWFLYLPNTIYLVTDLQYLPYELLQAEFIYKIALIFQYAVITFIGVVTYMVAMEPFERIFAIHKLSKTNRDFIYILLNFLISFAVVLGKIQRVNSWEVFTDPFKTVHGAGRVIFSPYQLLFIVLFGILTNIIYFALRHYFVRSSLQKKSKKQRKRR